MLSFKSLQKVDHRRTAIDAYVELYDRNPEDFVTREMMSDDASCAEGCLGTEEDKEIADEWISEMAEKAGFTNPTERQMEHLKVYEVIKPNWRSKTVSTE
jgi:hypothetical protein